MIRVDPMPHEFAAPHAGRIALANDCRTRSEFDGLLSVALGALGESGASSLPMLTKLALISGLAPTDYARQHSMLPGLRVASRPGQDLVHGAAEGCNFTRRLGMLTQRTGAYLCVQCVKEDLGHRSFSWFRRTHHQIGVDWCPTHRIALSAVTAANPWLGLPHHWVENGEILPLRPHCDELEEASFVGRYVEISNALLELPKPFDTRAISDVLAKRTRAIGLRSSSTGVRPLLSDHLKKLAPPEWLAQHVPDLHRKNVGEFFTSVDNLVSARGVPRVGYVYALALASLFDTAEEAMHVLKREAVHGHGERASTARAPRRRTRAFWHGEFWDVYVKFGGSTKLIGEHLQMERTSLQEKMRGLGLPSLRDLKSPKWRAFLRFHNGESFTRACVLEGADVLLVEALFRTTSYKVAEIAARLATSMDANMSRKTQRRSRAERGDMEDGPGAVTPAAARAG